MLTSRITLANGTIIDFFDDFSHNGLDLNPFNSGFPVYPAGRTTLSGDRRKIKMSPLKQARKAQKKARQKQRR